MSGSQLTSDRPTLLSPWTARDEAELRAARVKIEAAQKRREMAVDRVAAVLVDAGLARAIPAGNPGAPPTVLAEIAIQHADTIRDALAPFDSGMRPGAES